MQVAPWLAKTASASALTATPATAAASARLIANQSSGDPVTMGAAKSRIHAASITDHSPVSRSRTANASSAASISMLRGGGWRR